MFVGENSAFFFFLEQLKYWGTIGRPGAHKAFSSDVEASNFKAPRSFVTAT